MQGIEPVTARLKRKRYLCAMPSKAQTLPLYYAVQTANATSVLCRPTIPVKKSGMGGIEPGTAGCKAQTVPLCYAVLLSPSRI